MLPVPADCPDRSPPISLPAPLPPMLLPDVPVAGDVPPMAPLDGLVPDPEPPVVVPDRPEPEELAPVGGLDVPYPELVPELPVPPEPVSACPVPAPIPLEPDMLPVLARAWLPESPIVS